MLPNLLVIGAQKCGTTSLHSYLDQHADIAMSAKKEPHFFDKADCFSRLDWYESLFVDAPVRGESTHSYTVFPIASDVPERIRSLIPEAKLIYIVGDPIKRITSHWVQAYSGLADLNAKNAPRATKAARPLMEGLEDYADPYNYWVARSRYATQLEQYLKVFPQSQILVLDQSDLSDRPDETMREAYSFLGVDESFANDFSYRRNPSSGKRRQFAPYVRLHGRASSLGLGRLPSRIRRPVGRSLRRAFSRPVERPHLDASTLPGLTDLLHEEADRLRELTGKPFAKWSV